MEEIKNCKNCRYYLQHYIKRRCSYYDTCCGHCTKTKNKNKRELTDFCTQWESNQTIKQERQETIKKTLLLMARQISQIASIIEDDVEKCQ